MSDRELLEMAAKAAGIDKYWHHYELNKASLLVPTSEGEYADEWNPLIDDGDALRLAVKLELSITQSVSYVVCRDSHEFREIQGVNGDRHEATRRAIVRAAAEIGRAMP